MTSVRRSNVAINSGIWTAKKKRTDNKPQTRISTELDGGNIYPQISQIIIPISGL